MLIFLAFISVRKPFIVAGMQLIELPKVSSFNLNKFSRYDPFKKEKKINEKVRFVLVAAATDAGTGGGTSHEV